MTFIKAHKFNEFLDSENALKQINQGEGIPLNDDSVTLTYTSIYKQNGIYYIRADQTTQKYLGQPEDLEIIPPDI